MRPSILALAVLLLKFLFSWAFKSSICISLPGTLWNTLKSQNHLQLRKLNMKKVNLSSVLGKIESTPTWHAYRLLWWGRHCWSRRSWRWLVQSAAHKSSLYEKHESQSCYVMLFKSYWILKAVRMISWTELYLCILLLLPRRMQCFGPDHTDIYIMDCVIKTSSILLGRT